VRPGVVLVRDGEERVESIEAEVKRIGVGISGGVLSALACELGSGEGLRVRDLRC
jgi:NH3-dependent NAD+ synthetase